ncbi:MAG: DUF6431 domain-containing protein [Faecalibacillus intestinalis]|uniref:DUF6431 domain-containing protein n=1 Tax=Faecalibacillus intestinalis TaxID=1982626 RepID=UPI003A2DD30D
MSFFHFPCHSNGLIIHVYYDRHVDIFDRNHTIRILRLKCSSCNSTHAVLIEDTVPYSIVSFDIIIDVLKNKDFLSSSHVFFIKNKYLSFIIDYISFFWRKTLYCYCIQCSQGS